MTVRGFRWSVDVVVVVVVVVVIAAVVAADSVAARRVRATGETPGGQCTIPGGKFARRAPRESREIFRPAGARQPPMLPRLCVRAEIQ
jgi:hypothetical protein